MNSADVNSLVTGPRDRRFVSIRPEGNASDPSQGSRTGKDLTEQQARIVFYAKQGYAMSEVAQFIGRSPSQVSDQLGFARKKGAAVHPRGAYEGYRIPMPSKVKA